MDTMGQFELVENGPGRWELHKIVDTGLPEKVSFKVKGREISIDCEILSIERIDQYSRSYRLSGAQLCLDGRTYEGSFECPCYDVTCRTGVIKFSDTIPVPLHSVSVAKDFSHLLSLVKANNPNHIATTTADRIYLGNGYVLGLHFRVDLVSRMVPDFVFNGYNSGHSPSGKTKNLIGEVEELVHNGKEITIGFEAEGGIMSYARWFRVSA